MEDNRRRRLGSDLLAWGILFGALFTAIHSLTPEIAGADPQGNGFASLEVLAAKPHPLGSDAHRQVQRYLIEEIGKAGMHAELQQGEIDGEHLTNILAHHRGTKSTGTVVVMAHYDTVPDSPGAGDDSAGVVAVLEALRGLASKHPWNDVLFLFTDGEELSMLGSKLFVKEHKLMDDVEVVLNFEAIGNGGPVVMFESGPESGGLLELWRDAVPVAMGSSLIEVVFDWMPNNTDMSPFLASGKRGLNFGIAGASGYYHSPSDTASAFDSNTLAHMASTAVRMTDALSNTDLGTIAKGKPTYFAAPPFGVFVGKTSAHLWVAVGLWLAFWAAAFRGKAVTVRALLKASGVAMICALVAGACALVAGLIARSILGFDTPMSFANGNVLLFALLLGAVVGLLATCTFLARRARHSNFASELSMGALALWSPVLVLFALAEIQSPGASLPICIATYSMVAASALHSRNRIPSWLVALALSPGVYALAPILCLIVQLASKLPWGVVGIGSALLVPGALLVLPLAAGTRFTQRDFSG